MRMLNLALVEWSERAIIHRLLGAEYPTVQGMK